MLLFLVTPSLAVAVQPWMEWIPIKKKQIVTKRERERVRETGRGRETERRQRQTGRQRETDRDVGQRFH